MPPRAVIFDLDGTLIDSAHDITNVLNCMLAARQLPLIDVSLIKPLVSLGARDMIKRSFGKAAEQLDIETAYAEFQSIYRTIAPEPSCIFPHAVSMLKELRAKNIAIGICTNKPEDNARRILTALGFDPLIDVTIGRRDDIPAKPNPTPIFEILRQMNLPASDTVFVGDNEVDAETAVNAKVPFVLVSFGYPTGILQDIAHDILIDDFRDLPVKLLA